MRRLKCVQRHVLNVVQVTSESQVVLLSSRTKLLRIIIFFVLQINMSLIYKWELEAK